MGIIQEKIQDEIAQIEQAVIRWRRYLHQNPELSMNEVETSQFIYDTLLSFSPDIQVQRPTKTSVVARLKGQKEGSVLALRADIDALPIHEKTGLSFGSQNEGVMHACGHDGHAAMLLGAAQILVNFRSEISGEIIFIFQHAEEIGKGADEILATGVLFDVDYILGVHLYNLIPTGKFGIASGRLMAASDVFNISIDGKGGHAAEPDQAQDLIYVGSEIVQSLSQLVARQINANDQAIVSVTQFNAGSAANILPDNVKITGTIRTFSSDTRNFLHQKITEITEKTAEIYGAIGSVHIHKGATAVINHPEITDQVEQIILKSFGDEAIVKLTPQMISEDFGSYLTNIPGNFLFIGSGNVKEGVVFPLHHPEFTIDERALINGVRLHILTALFFLSGNND